MASNKNSFGKTVQPNVNKTWKDFGKKFPEYAHIPQSELKYNMDEFFKQATSFLVDKEHGLILNGIGYFGNAVYSNRKVVYNSISETLMNNSLTNGDIYTTTIYPYVFKQNEEYLFWLFRITRHAARRMAHNIIHKGVRYKCHSEFLKVFNRNHKTYLNDKPSK